MDFAVVGGDELALACCNRHRLSLAFGYTNLCTCLLLAKKILARLQRHATLCEVNVKRLGLLHGSRTRNIWVPKQMHIATLKADDDGRRNRIWPRIRACSRRGRQLLNADLACAGQLQQAAVCQTQSQPCTLAKFDHIARNDHVPRMQPQMLPHTLDLNRTLDTVDL